MKTAYLFPGQGSQFVGMGKDLYQYDVSSRALIDRAGKNLPFDLNRILFEGPAEELTQTRVTQPAIFVVSVAAAITLADRGPSLHGAAGHSLGEYSALVAAGAMDFDEALAVVALRGELMQNAGNVRPGAMAAVIGADTEQVGELCEKASDGDEVVVAANFNSPGQIVISGDTAAVDRAVAAAKNHGAKLAKRLNVSGAFHSPLMAPAAELLAAKLEQTTVRRPSVPVYLNVTAAPSTDPEEIRARLIDQLTRPVLWEQTLLSMNGDGFERYLEVGPGNVLQGLVKRTLKDATFAGAGTWDEIEARRGEIAG